MVAYLLLDVAGERTLVVLARGVEQLVEVPTHDVEEDGVLGPVADVVTDSVGGVARRRTIGRLREGHSRAASTW